METSKDYLDIVTGFPEICSQYPELFLKLLFCINERNTVRIFNKMASTKYLMDLLIFGIVNGNWLCENSTLAEGIHKHTELCVVKDNLIYTSSKGIYTSDKLDGFLDINPRNVTLNGIIVIHSNSAACEFILMFFHRKLYNIIYFNQLTTCCKTTRYKLEWNGQRYTQLGVIPQDAKIILPLCKFRNYCKNGYNIWNLCLCCHPTWRVTSIFGKEDMCFAKDPQKECRKKNPSLVQKDDLYQSYHSFYHNNKIYPYRHNSKSE